MTSRKLFLTEGGIETTLVFKKGVDLPHFCALVLLDTVGGKESLRECYTPYIDIATELKTGIVLETPTWRGSSAWAEALGIDDADIPRLNREAVKFLQDLRDKYESPSTPIVVSGNLGPLSDAYKSSAGLSIDSARACYRSQVEALCEAGVDMLSTLTLNNTTEAIAAAQLAKEKDMPMIVSFCVETNGLLLEGKSLADAIMEVDKATGQSVVYYGINCAHPFHFERVLRETDQTVRQRLGEIRANASVKSHDELDNSDTLDRGDPESLSISYERLKPLLPALKVVGGCCGTDEEHVARIGLKLIG
ncbi:hypothetical protein H2201_006479 [Coniosporium apollinis]|uniref:Hcy-binding domain-containing protein n=2 Tax=Coniosporium TaxID=2810619 RepID=A0ABQ9NLN1_9PEZI|nr:hypothetical protein H2199_007853 [Cladosporium sp. JES 115]KAJ9661448.1 hypothetical protein H2201_006479 [Coniosporium apollinis]